MATSIPTVKVERADNDLNNVKMEDGSSPSVASDAYMDDAEEDDPELNLTDAHKPIWLSKLPRHLWEQLASLSNNDEIEIGTIRVEGTMDNPTRVSLLLKTADWSRDMEKEYVLKRKTGSTQKVKRPGQVLMFSEKNKPGYKPRPNIWDQYDDEDQGRSQLYEQTLRAEKKKENKGRYTPYQRKPIPKITALQGTVLQEFECEAVDNAEHKTIEAARTRRLLGQKERSVIEISDHKDPRITYGSSITGAERRNILLNAATRRTAAKENRYARLTKTKLQEEMFNLFRQHKFWGLRDMRIHLRQPEQFVKENLEEIAIMHRSGDFSGKWELKAEMKMDDAALMGAVGVADNAEEGASDIDIEMKSEGDDEDDDQEFENVLG